MEAEKVGEGSAAHRASLAADALVGRAPGKQLALEVRRMWAIAAAARIAHELGVEEVRLATVARRAGIGEDAVIERAMADANVRTHLQGKEIRKRIFVPDKLLNIVAG